jgi:hypothetical protein
METGSERPTLLAVDQQFGDLKDAELVEDRFPVIHILESSGPPFLMKNW